MNAINNKTRNRNLIDNTLKSKLRDGDLRLTEFHNRKLALKKIVNNYLQKKILMWILIFLISRNSLKICQMLTIEYKEL